ncbi:MAG: PAS domain S-box protein [Bacteroidetes bacterium]|nr:PAS domain S-box protein [Bacteroidota bacterium]
MNNSEKLLRKRLLVQVFIPSAISFILLIAGYFIINPATKNLLIKDRKQSVRNMVMANYNLIDRYNKMTESGEITLEEAQKLVVRHIQFQRYGEKNSNYFWIQDYKGNILYHPVNDPGNESNFRIKDNIRNVALSVSNQIRKEKEGFISYTWYPLSGNIIPSQKEAFIKGYDKWQWIIGTGFLLHDIELELNNLAKQVLIIMFSLIFCIIGILSFVIFRNYNNLKKIIFTDIELKKSEARFRGFIENTDNGLLIFENNIPVFSNNKFNEIFQVNQDSLPNFRLADYIPAWEQERVKLMMSKSFQEAKTRFTTWLSNEKFVNLNFINDTETAGYYQYLVVQDNTEQKQILTTIDILSENIAKSNDSVVITDLNGNIEYVNPGFENLTGYTFEEVKGKKPAILKSNKMEPVIYKDLWNTITVRRYLERRAAQP